MSHDEPRLQLHAYLKSLSGYRGAPLHVDLCFYVCNPKNSLKYLKKTFASKWWPQNYKKKPLKFLKIP